MVLDSIGNHDVPSRRYLRNFCFPTDAERRKLRWFVEEAERTVDNLWEKEDLVVNPLGVPQRRESLVSSITRCKSVLAPIRRLPPEILGRVFFFALPEVDYVPMRKDAAPMLLTHVCKFWRDVAMFTPDLWTSLLLGDDKTQGRTSWPDRDTVRLWLERSGRHLLSIKLANFRGNTEPYLPLILPFADRLEDLCLHKFPPASLYEVFSPGHQYPRLKRLQVYTAYSRHAFDNELLVKSCAPHLQTFKVTLVFPPRPLPMRLSWPQVTEVRLSCVVPSDAMLRILSHCPQLVNMQLRIRPMRQEYLGPDVTHHTLREFMIKGDPCDVPFERLTLPQLTTVTIDLNATRRAPAAPPPCRFSIDKFADLVARSKCPLQGLMLAGACVTAREWARVFRLAPLLRKLVVIEWKYANGFSTDGVLDVLTCPLEEDKSYEFLPRLEDLALVGCSLEAMDLADELLALRSRIQLVPFPEDPGLTQPGHVQSLIFAHIYFRAAGITPGRDVVWEQTEDGTQYRKSKATCQFWD